MGRAERKARRAERKRLREERRQRERLRVIITDFTDEAVDNNPLGSVSEILDDVIDMLKKRFADRPILLLAIEVAATIVPLLLAR